MDFIEARGGEYIFHIRWSCNAVSCPNQIRDLWFRPAHFLGQNFCVEKWIRFWDVRILIYSAQIRQIQIVQTTTILETKWTMSIFYHIVDRLERWFFVVSDSRIQTGRKIIKDTKK